MLKFRELKKTVRKMNKNDLNSFNKFINNSLLDEFSHLVNIQLSVEMTIIFLLIFSP